MDDESVGYDGADVVESLLIIAAIIAGVVAIGVVALIRFLG
jgi:hypothetical protein